MKLLHPRNGIDFDGHDDASAEDDVPAFVPVHDKLAFVCHAGSFTGFLWQDERASPINIDDFDHAASGAVLQYSWITK